MRVAFLRFYLAAFCLLAASQTQAFYWLQAARSDSADSWRLGYHNDNPDLFWRVSAARATDRKQQAGVNSAAADWVIPVPATNSTVFIGVQLQSGDEPRFTPRAGVTLLKYMEFGWQAVPCSNNYPLYMGINLGF